MNGEFSIEEYSVLQTGCTPGHGLMPLISILSPCPLAVSGLDQDKDQMLEISMLEGQKKEFCPVMSKSLTKNIE